MASPSSDIGRMEAWRDADAVAKAGVDRYSVVGKGQSMAPLYGDNTMLVISKVHFGDLEAGMTVAFLNDQGRQVVHRLVKQRRDGSWTAQGYNNESADNSLVTPWNLIGVVYASLVHDFPEDS